MSDEIEIKMAMDKNGNQFYTKSHIDAIDGFENYYNDLIDVGNSLSDFQENYVSDTGWRTYDVHPALKKDILYAGSGFKCGIRQIVQYHGNKSPLKMVDRKMIRFNIRGFEHDTQIAQLPRGFMKNTQVFWARGGNGYKPIMVQVLNDGKVIPRLMTDDVNKAPSNNWIYGQFEWTE